MDIDKFLLIVLLLLIFLALGVTIRHGVIRQETNECLEWHNQSRIYENWTVADWQVAQCNHYGIKIEK